jgi:DNA-binding transcriptional regulator PaaX
MTHGHRASVRRALVEMMNDGQVVSVKKGQYRLKDEHE